MMLHLQHAITYLYDRQICCVNGFDGDAQNHLLWGDKTCPACLAHHEPESVKIISVLIVS